MAHRQSSATIGHRDPITALVGSELVLATSNPHKAEQFRSLLGATSLRLKDLSAFDPVSAVAEDGTTIAENARLKAVGYATQIGACVLADDTGLEVDALQGAPGVKSARFAGPDATMDENRAKLVRLLDGRPREERSARFVCCLALANPAGQVIVEGTGICHGVICDEAIGGKGFGYDSHFELIEYGKRLAELGPAATNLIGHRGAALRSLLRNSFAVL